MRYGSEHREKTHDSLVEAASALVRRDGPERVSVSELMKSVGLTHGGFYYHFSSREDMIARAIERAFAGVCDRLSALSEQSAPAEALRTYIERYLSPEHRDNRSKSCPIATLSAYVGSFGEESRCAFEHGAARLTSLVASLLEKQGHSEPGHLAISIMSEITGALALSRVISERSRSDEVLAICRRSILARMTLGNRGKNPSEPEA